jgi:hypothetical protein
LHRLSNKLQWRTNFKTNIAFLLQDIPTWDYGTNGAYFITICTKNRQYFFGECEKGKMKLSTLGAIAQGFWYEIPKHFPFVELGEFVVMPNHIHGVLILNKNSFDENIEPIDIIDPIDPVETGHCPVSTNERSLFGFHFLSKKFIIFPIQGIIDNVLTDSVKGLIITNNIIPKTCLPFKIQCRKCGMNVFGAN